MSSRLLFILASVSLAACSGSTAPAGGGAGLNGAGGGKGVGGSNAGGSGGDSGSSCAAGLVSESGKCVDPLRRYEPADRVDFSNVVSYGGALTLKLPDPPKSGFRLVVPPRTLDPGLDVQDCTAWAYPAIKYKNVYAARVYTTGALHHSNMYGVPLAASGPSPYPKCTAGQADLATQIPKAFTGNIIDVLFANSTQIKDGEQIVFPKGMAFKLITDGREVATSIHWLNVTSDPFTSEVVYDFFTMPDEDVTEELVPFVYDNQAFSIGANQQGHITSTCDLKHAGNIVSIMPHTHVQTTSFVADLVRADGTMQELVNDGSIDGQSQIKVFDQPISLEGFAKVHHECAVNNTTPKAITYGVGVNGDMCTLFGYLYPSADQQMGAIIGAPNPDGSSPACLAFDLGKNRPNARDR